MKLAQIKTWVSTLRKHPKLEQGTLNGDAYGIGMSCTGFRSKSRDQVLIAEFSQWLTGRAQIVLRLPPRIAEKYGLYTAKTLIQLNDAYRLTPGEIADCLAHTFLRIA